jgi:hypothetical protein
MMEWVFFLIFIRGQDVEIYTERFATEEACHKVEELTDRMQENALLGWNASVCVRDAK